MSATADDYLIQELREKIRALEAKLEVLGATKASRVLSEQVVELQARVKELEVDHELGIDWKAQLDKAEAENRVLREAIADKATAGLEGPVDYWADRCAKAEADLAALTKYIEAFGTKTDQRNLAIILKRAAGRESGGGPGSGETAGDSRPDTPPHALGPSQRADDGSTPVKSTAAAKSAARRHPETKDGCET